MRQQLKITKSDPFTTISVEDVIKRLDSKARYYVKIDLKSGFWHLKIREEDKSCFYGVDGKI